MNEAIQYIIEHIPEFIYSVTLAIIAFCGKYIWRVVKEDKLAQQGMQQGILTLLRSSLIRNYNDYKERGYIPVYAMENVEQLYQAYHALGGNGTITKLYEELKALPSTITGSCSHVSCKDYDKQM